MQCTKLVPTGGSRGRQLALSLFAGKVAQRIGPRITPNYSNYNLRKNAAVIIFTVMVSLCLFKPSADAQDLLKGSHQFDLAQCFSLIEYYVEPVLVKADPKSGFSVGGKNETKLIQGLDELNGRSIVDLEKDMRPGALSEVGSDEGFLGADESLLDVLVADNQYVVDDLGLTHQQLAKHMHAFGSIGFWQAQHQESGTEFVYSGRRFRVAVESSRGFQLSPFVDETKSNSDITVHNLDNGKTLKYALLVPYMIERYGFYEGRGTSYRVERVES